MNPLSLLNDSPWVRPALGVLTAVAVLVKYLAPPHTIAHQVSEKLLDLLAPLVAASVGKSHGPKPSPEAVDVAVAAKGGPLGVLRGTKDE